MIQLLAQQTFGFEGTGAEAIFVAGFGGLVIVAALVMRISLVQWLIVGMLFATALGAATNLDRTEYIPTWLTPLQIRRAEMHLGFGLLLTLIVIWRGVETKLISSQGLFILAIQFLAGFLTILHEKPPLEAVQTIVFALATVPCVMVVGPRIAAGPNGCWKIIRTMLWVGVIWAFACSVQFVLDPTKLVNANGRFMGMLSNPQLAAMLCSTISVIALWALLNDPVKRTRIFWVALIIIYLLFIIWTGSRTGALMTLTGAAVILYSRAGKAVLFLPVLLLVLLALSSLADALEIGSNLERLVSTENTREGVWRQQIDSFFEAPLIGVGWGETGGSESSYFASLGGYGIFMGALILAFLITSMWSSFKLWQGRKWLPKRERAFVDIVVAYQLLYFAGAAFEGYILGRSSSVQVMMLLFASISVHLHALIAERSNNAYGVDAAELEQMDEQPEPYGDSESEIESYASGPVSRSGPDSNTGPDSKSGPVSTAY